MTDQMLSEQLLMTCDWCRGKCASCRKIETDAAVRLKELSAEVTRLWRIAICETEKTEEMAAEISALGTATPEACRAIDAFNRRYDKIKAMARIQELERMVRTAQDASVIAILELEKWRTATGCQTPYQFTVRTEAIREQMAIEVATNSGEAAV